MTPCSPKRPTTALNVASKIALSRNISVQKSYTIITCPQFDTPEIAAGREYRRGLKVAFQSPIPGYVMPLHLGAISKTHGLAVSLAQ